MKNRINNLNNGEKTTSINGITTEIDSYPKDINIRRVNIRGVYIDILDPKKMKFT